ncbi:PAS domain S-box protein [Ktedonobacter racemifer]|uniref:histidine kinase n=1 Tax=Ktedonobacter racemifer DSM 44963 TaxID=485913 RepID=D6TGA0_KTERA|nr:PAS domain S-box protein [Ktedonobacter racemifer]EFH88802.1 PAS/PAC sensor signal transduction histidine kinase [Ktedonobacter racemifer DSM 44963]
MSNAKQTKRVTPGSRETLLHMLEILPDAVFVVDDTETIVYANASAQTLTGTTREEVCGTSLWCSAPHLVSPSLYQAVHKAKQTREPTEVAYVSPATNRWLHVSLSSTDEGLALFFQEQLEPLPLQHALSQDEHMYRDLLEGFSDGVMIVTPDGLVLDINQRPLADAHLRREEVVGTPVTDLPAWSSDPVVQEHLSAAIARASRGETVLFEAKIHPRPDLSLDILMTITSHRDASQQVEYLICAGRDITERKHAEEELRVLIDAIPQLVWMARPDGSRDYCNRRWCDYTDMTSEQYQGDGWLQAIHPDDQQRVLEVWQHSVQTGRPYETELRLRQGTTGAYRWFLVRAMQHKDDQGTTLKWFGTCTDIDDQKQAEQRLKASEENWRVLAETVPQLVWTTRPDGRVDYCNQRFCEYMHAAFEQLQGYGWRQFLHPEDVERVVALRHHTLETGEPFESEHRFRNGRTGAYHWFLARGMPVRNEAGQIVKWFGTCTDIDDQKRIEEALRQSQKRIRALIDSNIIGIVSVEGEEDVLVEANNAYLHMTGYTQEDVRSRTLNVERTTPSEQAHLFHHALQELAARGQHTPFETELVCKDGSRLPVLVGGVIFQECPRQIIGFVLDNSARKELEQRKDDFISMASHELRSPLTAMKLQTTLLHRQLAKQGIPASAPALSSMETQINKVSRLVEELLDVSKIQAGRLEYRQETVDLDALLWEIADTMQQTHPSYRILVHGAVRASLMADRDRLGQVFTNLLSNAVKYSPDAQTVEMDLSTSQETVTIRVHDHGLGIPREQREKIFDRFYRATGPSQKAIPGLGMGLYIVAEIVKHHGGTIMVESTVGKGSTFTVTIPRNRDS